MELSTVSPLIMIAVLSLFSIKTWKENVSQERILLVSMGWAALFVLSFASAVFAIVTGKFTLCLFLLALSMMSCLLANKFAELHRLKCSV